MREERHLTLKNATLKHLLATVLNKNSSQVVHDFYIFKQILTVNLLVSNIFTMTFHKFYHRKIHRTARVSIQLS